MPQIRPITDFRNTTEIFEFCHAGRETFFITKNGYGDLVVMGKAYEEMAETAQSISNMAKGQQEIGKSHDRSGKGSSRWRYYEQ